MYRLAEYECYDISICWPNHNCLIVEHGIRTNNSETAFGTSSNYCIEASKDSGILYTPNCKQAIIWSQPWLSYWTLPLVTYLRIFIFCNIFFCKYVTDCSIWLWNGMSLQKLVSFCKPLLLLACPQILTKLIPYRLSQLSRTWECSTHAWATSRFRLYHCWACTVLSAHHRDGFWQSSGRRTQ